MADRTPNSIIFKLFLAFTLSASVTVHGAENDPLEPVNRAVFAVNNTLDRFLLRPTAIVYKAILPNFAERGVRNFFSNLGEVSNALNNGLQGKFGRTVSSTERLIINSTVGVGGLFDVATKIGIEKKAEDFGQTFGVWGVPAGPYLVLPILGPSNLRDSVGLVADPFVNPITYVPFNSEEKLGFIIVDGVQTRADLLSAESMVLGDPYVLYREAYLSKREFDVADGLISQDDFLEGSSEDWGEGDFLNEEF